MAEASASTAVSSDSIRQSRKRQPTDTPLTELVQKRHRTAEGQDDSDDNSDSQDEKDENLDQEEAYSDEDDDCTDEEDANDEDYIDDEDVVEDSDDSSQGANRVSDEFVDEIVPSKGHRIQCASYGLELLSHGELATHRFGFLVIDGKIQIHYYDRSAPFMSTVVDFVKNPTFLVALLDCMVSGKREDWGFIPRIIPPPTVVHPSKSGPAKLSYLANSTFKCSNGATLTFGKIIFRQHALIGRGTCIVKATSNHPAWVGKSIIVKITFTPDKRLPEGEILNKIMKHAKGPNDRARLNHLPEVLHYEGILPGNSSAQTRLAEYFQKEHRTKNGKAYDYEMRNIQLLVMTELFPIKHLQTSAEVLAVTGHIVECKSCPLSQGFFAESLTHYA